MPFKSILSITGAEHGNGDIDLAADLCEPANTHLSVLVVRPAPPPPVGEFGAMASDIWVRAREADLAQLEARVADVSALLAKRAIPADVTLDYPELAWTEEAIGRRARYADLTVMGPELLGDEALKRKVFEGVLFHSGRPILVLPKSEGATLSPKRIMIGWDTRVEASRALRESLDLMESADEVRLVLVDPVEGERGHGAEPGADAAAYLARHGAKVTVDRLPKGSRSTAEVLSTHAVDCAADLLVVGAYGHSRLRERIFGGVTKSFIDTAPLAILMAR